jgi:hypothetical protein
LALRRFGAATLRNAYRLDGAVHAGRHVLLAEEAAIGAIKVRRTAEGAAMEPERRRHVNFVGRVSFQHLILGNQASGAFGEKYLVTEFHWRAHLATLDQIGVRFEDRIDLLGRGHLFAIEHTAARLLDHPRAEIAIMHDLIAQGLDLQSDQRVLGAHRGSVVKRPPGASYYFLGNADQRPVGRSLPRSFALTLPRRHPLSHTCADARHASDCESPRCAAAPAPWQADRGAA